MTSTAKAIIIVLSAIILIVIGGLYFLRYFFSAFAHPKETVTSQSIKTNRDFKNGVTIEKIQVDSIGEDKYPVKYTVVYTTSCSIDRPVSNPPDPPSIIEFNKPGKYSWDEDTFKIRNMHSGLSRILLDTSRKSWWLNKFGKHPACPIVFEQEQWYFITVGNLQVTGIFFYIDSTGKEHQCFFASRVSPV